MTTDARVRYVASHLWDVVEPIAANVYFAPEVHSALEAIGFNGSRAERGGIHYPDGMAYFVSRGACLGQVPGEVIAAAFGVFKREMVVGLVAEGWNRAGRDAVLAAREEGATASLRRILGENPAGLARATHILQRAASAAPSEGRHLFSGLLSLGYPDSPMGAFWRAADLVREHRGDSHIIAWTSRGFDACEIGLLTDPWRGQPWKSWVRSRGWSEEELDAGMRRLDARGLVAGEGLSEAGVARRDEIEDHTDELERRVVEAIGSDAEELFSILEPWAAQVIEARGYPTPVVRPRAPQAVVA